MFFKMYSVSNGQPSAPLKISICLKIYKNSSTVTYGWKYRVVKLHTLYILSKVTITYVEIEPK